MRLPPESLNLVHDVRGAKIARTWAESSCAAVSVLYRPSDGIRDVAPSRGLGDVYKRQRLEYLGFQHPDLELERSARSVVQFEGILPEAVPGAAYAPADLDGHVGVVVDVPPEV